MALNPTRDNPCISPANLSPSGTYVERPAISAEIASKMQKSSGSKTLVHALALVGLGGTGKTQLVLRYIEQHKNRYDTILWLDVRDETTTMSSFKRCCGALSIALEQRPTDGLLHDAPAVQNLLAWLAARGKEQKWLVVVDNADGLDKRSDLTPIIPYNALAGSVIITSQDGKAAKLIPRAKCTDVDRMDVEECKALLARCMEIDISQASLGLTSCLEKLANRLQHLALALDLAGARIRDDMDNQDSGDNTDTEDPVISAVEQYLVDLEEHAKSVLSDSDLSTNRKTVWSVWETILSSLKRSEQDDDSDCPDFTIQLLKLAVVLGPAIVHRETFRAASQSLAAVCTALKTDLTVPPWFKHLLKVSETGTWDSFAYRKTVARLKRFNLIRPASQDVYSEHVSLFDTHPMSVSWPGFTIHGLVRWCTAAQTQQAEYEICRVVLVWACCRTWNECDDGVDFRPALFEYIRQRKAYDLIAFTEKGYADSCFTIGTTFARVRDYDVAGAFLEAARDWKAELFGENASETMHVEVELGRFYLLRSFCYDDPVDGNIDAAKAELVLGPIRKHTEGWVRIAAASWDATMMAMQLGEWSAQVRKEETSNSTGEEAERRRMEAWSKYLAALSVAISAQLTALQLGVQCLGQNHRVVDTLRSNLVDMYGQRAAFDLAKKYLDDLLARDEMSLGKLNDRRVRNTERLVTCQLRLRKFSAAAKTMREICSNSRTALGHDDPRTRARERRLEELTNLMSAIALTTTTEERLELEKELKVL